MKNQFRQVRQTAGAHHNRAVCISLCCRNGFLFSLALAHSAVRTVFLRPDVLSLAAEFRDG